MKLIYILGAADGKVEEFKPALSGAFIPPDSRMVCMGETNEAGDRLFVRYIVMYWEGNEAYYLPANKSKTEAIIELSKRTPLR